MAALQKGALQEDRPGSAGSDVESEDDNEDDNDYTVQVYEIQFKLSR